MSLTTVCHSSSVVLTEQMTLLQGWKPQRPGELMMTWIGCFFVKISGHAFPTIIASLLLNIFENLVGDDCHRNGNSGSAFVFGFGC